LPSTTKTPAAAATDANEDHPGRMTSCAFYAGLVAMCQYPSTTVRYVEDELPGGHRPRHFRSPDYQPGYRDRDTYGAHDPRCSNGFPQFVHRARSARASVVGARRLDGGTITNSGSARESRSTFARALRTAHSAATECSSTCCASSGGGRQRVRGGTRPRLAIASAHQDRTSVCSAPLCTTRARRCCIIALAPCGDEAFFKCLRRSTRSRSSRKRVTYDLKKRSIGLSRGMIAADRSLGSMDCSGRTAPCCYARIIGPGAVTVAVS
jgi:hypothetical protein